MSDENLIIIGRISGPFGIKGEMRVILNDISPDIILQNKIPLILQKTGLVLNTIRYRNISGGHAFFFSEIADRNIAETLPKSSLLLNADLLPKSDDEDDEVLEDIVGFNILLLGNNESIGIIENIYDFGAGEIIEFKDKNDKIYMMPASSDIILQIDFENKIIYVDEIINSYMA